VRNLADFLADARTAGCWCYGASAPAVTGAGGATGAAGIGAAGGAGTAGATVVGYDEPDYGGGVVVVFGSEGAGLRPRVAAACDQLISLPLLGRIESLGVSAAAAAVLYEILQNRTRGLDKAP